MMEEQVIEIAPHLLAEVRRVETLRQHYLTQLNALGQELRTLLQHGHGIDVAEPGWRLDAEAGLLAYVPPAPPPPPVTPPVVEAD